MLLWSTLVRADSVLTVCDEKTLRAALAAGGTVQIVCDGSIALSAPLLISRDTVLDATGHAFSLDGNRTVQVLQVQGNVRFTLVGVTIRRGRAPTGGGLSNNGGRITLRHVTFTENEAVGNVLGNIDGLGGAIHSSSGELSAAHTLFASNRAIGSDGARSFRPNGRGQGGAVAAQGLFSAVDCVFRDNFSQGGGGGAFEGGHAQGGAIYATESLVIRNCLLERNYANAGRGCDCGSVDVPVNGNAQGGAVFTQGSSEITESAFWSNRVEGPFIDGGNRFTRPGECYGGALYNSGSCRVTNVTWVENQARVQTRLRRSFSSPGIRTPQEYDEGLTLGGALFHAGGAMTLTHVTLVDNAALPTPPSALPSGLPELPWDGYLLTTPATNVAGAAVTAVSSALQMTASILAGGTNQQFLGTLRDEGSNLTSDPSVPLTAPTSRRISDLKLGSFGTHGGLIPTVSLLPGSPAIDAAFEGNCPRTDQREVARPVGERCDIGAYEWLPKPLSRWSQDGFFQWELVLQPQQRYQIETTVDWAAWIPVESLRSDTLGRITFTDRQTARTPWRFYRIVDQP